MKKLIVLMLCAAWFLLAHAQPANPSAVAASASSVQTAQTARDVQRGRIGAERMRLQSAIAADEAACHRKFLANNCLDKVRLGSREALAELRRQEIALNDQERKTRAAAQIQKTEAKSSPEKQQETAERKAAALKDFDARMAHEKEKSAGRETAQSNEKSNSDAAAGRARGNQEKAVGRTAKESAAAEEVKKFNERLEKAKDRQQRHDREQAAQTKAAAKPLPQPQ